MTAGAARPGLPGRGAGRQGLAADGGQLLGRGPIGPQVGQALAVSGLLVPEAGQVGGRRVGGGRAVGRGGGAPVGVRGVGAVAHASTVCRHTAGCKPEGG
nr:MAG TPA: hypothetical protein [Caudoviricetes sp.]